MPSEIYIEVDDDDDDDDDNHDENLPPPIDSSTAEMSSSSSSVDSKHNNTNNKNNNNDDDNSSDSDDSDNDEEEEIILGQPQSHLNPHSTSRCWSCFVRFRHGGIGYYTTHEHPLLGIVVCSVCQDAAEVVEGRILMQRSEEDDDDDGTSDGSDNDGSSDDGSDNEQYCSWCALPLTSLQPPHPPLADDRPNDLFLCDTCPRSFCQKCLVVSRGGDEEALRYVRRHAESEEGWSCCVCVETEFLGRLKEGYARLLTEEEEGGGGRRTSGETKEAMRNNNDKNEEDEEENKDRRIARLIDELRETELKYAEAQESLEEEALLIKRREIELELEAEEKEKEKTKTKKKKRTASTPSPLSAEIDREMHNYKLLWMNNSERLQETIGKLLNELEDEGVNVLDVYRFFEEEKEKSSAGGGAGGEKRVQEEEEETPSWKYEADRALDQRDIEEGFNKGEFRGATGYKAKDTRIYKLEPEDLNPTCLNEIEDINTTEGAISQMNRLKSLKETSNPWASKTGITQDDIEMFEKKCTKFEELTLGSKIDLKALERNCTKDKDDAALDKTEGVTMTIRRKNGKGRVVRRTASVRSVILQNEKESNSSRLLGVSKEYKPCLPAAPEGGGGDAVAAPKPKKRAQLLHSSSSLSAHVTPSMKGILIGNDVEFVNSQIVLPVKKCTDTISICKPLASVLMEHQIEGVRFCWTRICENLAEERGDEVRGAILAHSMGVGKSIQTISLLHTLLTHPSLVHSSAITNGRTRRRIIHKALLIAPVNTLANWESEFKKWIGVSSGKNLPFVRFYSWDQKNNKEKLINEWHKYGGVLCTSSGRYSSTASKFFKKDGVSKDSKTNSSECDNDILYRALVNPGPDIVVLDEAHTMLKNSNSSIFKVLDNLGTKLRLSLTGTPLQNNLMEYFRMANWTEPGCLGTEISFTNKYERPIMIGMAADCTPTEAAAQEKLSSELHRILSSIVHRCGRDVLKKALPFKQEAVIHIRQSKPQAKLYREFSKYKKANNVPFWEQYHALRPISNHPACLSFFRDQGSRSASPITAPDSGIDPQNQPTHAPKEYAWFCDKCKVAKFDTLEDAVDHEATCQEVPADNDCGNKEWWKTFYDNVMKSGLDIKAIEYGGKIVVLLQILAHCDSIGDKVVVFSQCLKTLDYIEEILQMSDWGGFLPYLPDSRKKFGGWKLNSEISRIDGSVDANTRGELISTFNSVDHSKVFLVSTLAGGLGINLVAANRVVLLDTHWNPAISDQAVHRCYRIGQTKPVYCYRLLAEGTMEEKIFSRAATKTSLSDLVIDAKNIDRLFSRREMDLLQENDTWVMCDACGKWRMLCPDAPDDEVKNLPEQWYCKLNIHDPDRSVCDAPEQESLWYAHYWESRRKENEGTALPSFVERTSNNHREMFTKRDIVLQTLLSRSEGTARTSAAHSTNSWISKYVFSKETVQAADELVAKATPNTDEAYSPKRKKTELSARETKTATRTSPRTSDARQIKSKTEEAASLSEENAGRNQVSPLRGSTSVATGGTSLSPMQDRIPRKTATPRSSRQITDNGGSSSSDRLSRRKSAPLALAEHNAKRTAAKEEELRQRQKRKSLPPQSSSIDETTAVENKRKALRSLTPSAKKISKSNSEVKMTSKDPETIDLCLDSDSD